MNNKSLKFGGISKPKSTANTASSSRQDLKSRINSHLSGTSTAPQKRVANLAHAASAVAKRPKIDPRAGINAVAPSASGVASTSGAANTSANSSFSASAAKLMSVDASWMEFAADIDVPNARTFESAISQAKEKNKPNRMARTVCAAVKVILSVDDPLATHKDLIGQVITVVKEEERLMKSGNVFMSLLALLNAVNGQLATLQVNTLITLLTQMTHSLENWPLAAVNYTLNDSLGLRNWVDRANATLLLQSMCSIFGNLSFPSEQACTSCELAFVQREPFEGKPKFNKTVDEISVVTRSVREYFEKRAEPTKNTLKTLALCAANAKLRLWAAKKLDGWLQNGKLQRQAMELLLFVAANIIDSFSEENIETLLCLVSLRALRSKQIMGVFQYALREILTHCPGACSVLITVIMDNEFGAMKFQHNMSVLQLIYNFNFGEASEVIAKNLIKRLENPDSVKSVRVFLRDFVRSSVRSDFSFSVFAKSMFTTFRNVVTQVPQHLQDMLFRAFVDVCAMLPFLSITPFIKESMKSKAVNTSSVLLNPPQPQQPQQMSASTSAAAAAADSVGKYYTQLGAFMFHALDFLKWAGRLLAINSKFYLKSYYILMYFGNYSFYNGTENWPSESEFNQFMKVISECPADEAFVSELIEMGSAVPTVQRHSLSLTDVISLLESLTRRCLAVRGFENEINPILSIKSPQTADKLFRLSIYCSAEENSLGKQLATRSLYWRAWALVVIWACLNRSTILKGLYEKMPTLRMALLMVITKDYQFPVPGLDGIGAAQLAEDDERLLVSERKLYKELSARDMMICLDDNSNLSSSSSGTGGFTTSNQGTPTKAGRVASSVNGGDDGSNGSASNPPICVFNPTGIARRPPQTFFDHLRYCNEQYSLYVVLCSLRSPDILRQLLEDQGTLRTIPAVTQMVLGNSALCETAIPLPCLCQLMILITQQNLGLKSQFQRILAHVPIFPMEVQALIRNRLKTNLLSAPDEQSVRLVLNFMLEKLASPIFDEREAAVHLIRRLLKSDMEFSEEFEVVEEDEEETISSDASPIAYLTSVSYFLTLKNEICSTLGQCCIIENNVSRLIHYIHFISKHAGSAELNNVASRLSSLVKRTSDDSLEHKRIRDCLTDFYARYIRKFESTKSTVFNKTAAKATAGRKLSSASDDAWDADLSLEVSEANLLHISICDPPMEFDIEARIVSTVMELLSEAFCDDTKLQPPLADEAGDTDHLNSREYLMKIFFPKPNAKCNQLTVTRASDRNHVVDVLPSHLKMKMLSAHDERIVKVALDGVTPEQALQFLQSFALSAFSCSQLLSILNHSELGRSRQALAAVPFVRAYMLKGASGCEQFLSNMETFVKNVGDSGKSFTASLLSEAFQKSELQVEALQTNLTESQADLQRDFSTPSSVTEYLTDLLSSSSTGNDFDVDSETISAPLFRRVLASLEAHTSATDGKSANERVQYAKAVVTFIGQKFQLFVHKMPNTLSAILLVLMDVCAKNNNIRFLLANLAERAERICPDAHFVASLLYRFHAKHGGASSLIVGTPTSATKRKIGAGGSIPAKLSIAEANELLFEAGEEKSDGATRSVLEKLSQFFVEGKLTELQVGALVEKYCVLYPQFFQALSSGTSFDLDEIKEEDLKHEVICLFSSNCAPIADLVSQITIYSSVSIVQHATDILLATFIKGVVPSLVIEFVENAVVTNTTQCRHFPSAEQCAVLLEYVLAEFFIEEQALCNNKTNNNTSRSLHLHAPSKVAESVKGSKAEISTAAAGNVAEDTSPVIEQLLRILVAVLEPRIVSLSESGTDSEAGAVSGRRVLRCLRLKVAALESSLRSDSDAESRRHLTALKFITKNIERKFPGFSCGEALETYAALPPAMRTDATPGGHFGVRPALFIGSRKQLLRPIELLSITDFDDILHRTITDLHNLINENMGTGFSHGSVNNPTKELIINIITNLLAEAKAKPYTMARQLPLLSIFVSGILQRNFRQFRDAPMLLKFLEMTLDVILCTAPNSFEDVQAVEFIFQSFLNFFDGIGKGTRAWWDVMEKCALALLKFDECNRKGAAPTFARYRANIRALAKRASDRRPIEMARLVEVFSAGKTIHHHHHHHK